VLARRRLADTDLLRDQQTAHAVAIEVAVDLTAKMRTRICQLANSLIIVNVQVRLAGSRERIMDTAAINPTTIAEAFERIRNRVRVTPVVALDGADLGLAPMRLVLKLEQLQHSGSFKVRGAFANLVLRDVPPAGVTAASGGNHGAAVAFAARALGVPAKIFVPTVSSRAKVERIRGYGADLTVVGESYADALAASEAWIAQSGSLSIHAFDQVETILGTGTLGLELESQAPDLNTVLVAVGGGGLIAGVAAWYQRRTRIVGVEPKNSPTLFRAFEAGGPVDAETAGIAADSLAPRRVGELVYPIAKAQVDRVVLVSDAAIVAAQQALWGGARIVAEPGAAAPFAALASGAYVPQPGERVGVVISGANTTAVDFDPRARL
jgi:threonine dehydratase